jgi:hypothetical protein
MPRSAGGVRFAVAVTFLAPGAPPRHERRIEEVPLTSPTTRVPQSQPADATDVTLALEVASAVWEKGDGPDAIKWLMRAVEAAEDAGHSGRAETFMRAIADISRAMEPGHSGAAPAPPAPKTPPPPPPVPGASTAPRTRTQPPPLPPAASRAPTPPPPPATATPPSLRPPPTPSKASPANLQSTAPPAPSKAPPPPSWAPTPPPAPVARHAEAARADTPAPSPKTSESRIRVYVRRSTLDPSLFVVRPLADGSALPAGAREGSLALFGADFDEVDGIAAR